MAKPGAVIIKTRAEEVSTQALSPLSIDRGPGAAGSERAAFGSVGPDASSAALPDTANMSATVMAQKMVRQLKQISIEMLLLHESRITAQRLCWPPNQPCRRLGGNSPSLSEETPLRSSSF